MLSTMGLSQWLAIISIAALCFSACAVALSLYFAHKLRTEYPSQTLLNAVRGELDDLSGALSDLKLRFSRFQKREGMVAAREAKKTAADLQAEALQILGQEGSQAGPGTHPKAELYKRMRNH